MRTGLNKYLLRVIDLDLKSFFDTVRHDLLLDKLAARIQDRDLLWLSKLILRSGGERGLPQGSVVGPMWANVFLTEIDGMLERAGLGARLVVLGRTLTVSLAGESQP